MEVLAMVSPKGGAGKTALAVALAVEIAHDGRTPCIVDLDPQGSSRNWGAMRAGRGIEPAIATALARPTRLAAMLDTLRAMETPPDAVILDTPAALLRTTGKALELADRALAPVTPSMVDLAASQTLVEVVTAAGFSGARPMVVLNRVRARGSRGAEARQWLERIAGLDVCGAEIGDRVIMPDSFSHGLAPREMNPTAPGAREIAALARELKLIGNGETET